MFMFVWLWAVSATLAPTQHLMTMATQALDAQRATVEAVAMPLMTLGWVDEDDAPIF